MNMREEALGLLEQLPGDSIRYPLVVENPDWDTLLRPLQVILSLMSQILTAEQMATMLSLVLESAYTLGYQYGQRANSIEFVVEDSEEE